MLMDVVMDNFFAKGKKSVFATELLKSIKSPSLLTCRSSVCFKILSAMYFLTVTCYSSAFLDAFCMYDGAKCCII